MTVQGGHYSRLLLVLIVLVAIADQRAPLPILRADAYLTHQPLWSSTRQRNGQSTAFSMRTRMFAQSSTPYADVGLYRTIAEKVWDRLLEPRWNLQAVDIPPSLQSNSAVSKGPSNATATTMTRMTTRALEQAPDAQRTADPIAYARMALLETVPIPDQDDDESSTPATAPTVHSTGIQVLNLVIFPSIASNLPVWGADFVTLPGSRHLLLLDAQPMATTDTGYETKWNTWYEAHDVESIFPWGGDMPEPVQQYVSKRALWTRFGANEDAPATKTKSNPIDTIRGPLETTTVEHLKVYLQLLEEHARALSDPLDNNQRDYIRYRLENDPARPMLKSLFGEDWTERVLSEVLFPKI